MPIDVDECWAVGLHSIGPNRTPLGDLLNEAKTYGHKLGSRRAAEGLASCVAWWAERLTEFGARSQIGRADLVCSVPANPPKQPYNLPDLLAAAVASRLGVPCDPALIRKARPITEIKLESDKAVKDRLLDGVFTIGRAGLTEKVVVVVDDLVCSGATLEAIARVLRSAGAKRVIAITATKASKGPVG